MPSMPFPVTLTLLKGQGRRTPVGKSEGKGKGKGKGEAEKRRVGECQQRAINTLLSVRWKGQSGGRCEGEGASTAIDPFFANPPSSRQR